MEKKGLNGGTNDGDHGKTAVDDLLGLGLLDEGGILALESVRAEADVTGLTLAIVLVEVGELDDANGEEDLEVADKANGADGLEGILGSELVAGEVGKVLLPDHTDDGKHGGAAVLELGPAGVLKVGLDLREAHGVEAHVAGHRSVELLRAGKEGDRLGHLGVDGNGTGTLGGLWEQKRQKKLFIANICPTIIIQHGQSPSLNAKYIENRRESERSHEMM